MSIYHQTVSAKLISSNKQTEGKMKSIKFTLAAVALAISSGANAMPETVPEGYYDKMLGQVYVVLGIRRPCVGQPRTWC
jgi:hypothetical protein